MPTPAPGSDPLRGVLWMAFATLAGTGMLICIRFAGRDVHTLEVSFFRSLLALALLLPWYLPRQGWRLPRAHWRWQVARGTALAITMICYFAAVTLLPLAEVIALNMTAPLFATLGAALFLGERVGRRRWIAILAGFAGALLIAAPDPLAPGHSPLGIALALAAAVLGALELLLLKVLSGRSSTWTNVVWATLAMTIASAPPAALVWTPPGAESLAWMLGLAVAATISQASVTRAFYWSEVTPVMAATFLQLVLAALAGLLLFGETMGPTTALGAVLIVGANLAMLRHRHPNPA
jgi:drug/metabolite transporter (DMT)-like permease